VALLGWPQWYDARARLRPEPGRRVGDHRGGVATTHFSRVAFVARTIDI
jgi:hypothetical protein